MHAGITYKTSTCINAVDLKAKKLTAESGDTFTYEKLIIATGCRVRRRRQNRLLVASDGPSELHQLSRYAAWHRCCSREGHLP